MFSRLFNVDNNNKMCSESANSAKTLQCRRLVSDNCPSPYVKEKLILDPHPDTDQHQIYFFSRQLRKKSNITIEETTEQYTNT